MNRIEGARLCAPYLIGGVYANLKTSAENDSPGDSRTICVVSESEKSIRK